jgi:protein required for attachment to host cells
MRRQARGSRFIGVTSRTLALAMRRTAVSGAGQAEEIPMKKIPTGAWIVVADGTGARLLRNVGKGLNVSLEQVKLVGPKDLAHEGPAGRQPPERSTAEIDEATFVKQLAQRLNAAALKNEYAHLVLVADPQTLGQMRPLLHEQTTKRMVEELNKSLFRAPLEEIERALKATW